jgi:hypothetical protein
MNVRLILIASIAAVPITALAQTIKAPSGPYKLVYNVTQTGQRKGHATFALIESGGGLRVIEDSNSRHQEFVYKDGISLAIDESHQGIGMEGFVIAELEIPLYMPFDFQCVEAYMPVSKFTELIRKTDLSKFPADLRKSFMDPGDANFAVQMTPSTLLPARLQHRDSSSRETASLRVGAPKLPPAFTLQYEEFEPFAGTTIPRKITVAKYGHPKKGSNETIKIGESVLTLSSSESSKSIPAVSMEAVLKSGDWISFQGKGGAAGVIYDPREGSFTNQLGKQVVADKTAPVVSNTPVSPRPWTNPALILAGVFALLALYFLFRKSTA